MGVVLLADLVVGLMSLLECVMDAQVPVMEGVMHLRSIIIATSLLLSLILFL
jgi:hypothetical protein